MDGVADLSSDRIPLTDLQQGYLVGVSDLMELGGIQPGYYVELDVVGLDLGRAEQAARRLITRHEHLRTLVGVEGQLVLPDGPRTRFELVVADLRGQSSDRQEAAISQTRYRMCHAGIDPGRWPLFEVGVSLIRPRRARVHIGMSLLLLDGRSIRQVVGEWLALYQDGEAVLPPVGQTYRASRAAQLAYERTDFYRADWQYWSDRLDSLPEAPVLPLAKPPASISPVRFTRRQCSLAGPMWKQLCSRFLGQRVLPTAAMLHVFAEVLGGWAAAPEFCLNILHQGWVTSHPESAGSVGQLGATLPLEVDLRGPGDFWDRARRLQAQLWRDLEHGAVTAVRVTREMAARRGWTSRAVLPYVFTSMLGSGGQDALPYPACRVVTSYMQTPQVLIDNQVQDAPGGGVECVWDVVDGAFPDGLPDLMFAAYQDMLNLLAGPDGATARPSPVGASHLGVVAARNETSGTVPAGRLEQGFLDQAARRGDAPAVIDRQGTVTYQQLAAVSAAVAAWLADRGIGPGDIVPVIMTKGWEQVAAVLGVLRAGAAYCPVDASLPAARLRLPLEDCSARAVLCQSWSRPEDQALGDLPVLSVDDVSPGGPHAVRIGGPGDLAYLIYTSGSTGSPKGVLIEHASALNTVTDISERIGLHPGDRVFGTSSLSFDLSVWDIFGTLSAGATLILPGASAATDPVSWVTAAAHGVTVWNSVPALAEMLAELAEQRPELGRPPVRVFLLSGDWIPVSLPGRLLAGWPDARIIAMGGATEASIWSNFFEVERVDRGWRSIPYGAPLRNQIMRVLDHRLDVRAPWAVGPIYIGGMGLARGYHRAVELTEERFIRHPATGERLYRTGDLGRYWTDGTIELLGREDRQVKVQGFRVEPGEVEAAVRTHPDVRECVTWAERTAGGQQLVCLAVAEPGQRPDGPALIAHLRARLPSYMVPSRVAVVDRLPLTRNGKVDTVAASRMLAAGDERPASSRQASGAAEALSRRLGGFWAELLGVAGVDPDDSFFALGGNSLLALRLIHRIRADLGRDLPLGQVFETPTLRGLTAAIAGGSLKGRCLVTLADRPGLELVLFHPVGGSVTSYSALAAAWPGPVLAFQSRALAVTAAAGGAPAEDLVEMAASYREELQAEAPAGPYLLGGWSMGGVLAYEVGRQLTSRGQEAAIVMIDCSPAGSRPHQGAAVHLEFLRDLGSGRLPASVAAVFWQAAAGSRARAARNVAVSSGLLPAEVDVPEYERLLGIHASNLAALAAYQPQPSTASVLLFQAAAAPARSESLTSWRAVCPHLEVDVLDGDHYSIVTGSQTAVIARRVSAWIGGRTATVSSGEEYR